MQPILPLETQPPPRLFPKTAHVRPNSIKMKFQIAKKRLQITNGPFLFLADRAYSYIYPD
jgi:hypothetical protein